MKETDKNGEMAQFHCHIWYISMVSLQPHHKTDFNK